MKILVTILVAVVLGLLVGFSAAALRARNPAAAGGAKVAVDADGFDFGEMDCSQDGSHAFNFANKGTSPLMLTRGATSCSCTLGEISEPILAPGQSTAVRVTWKSKQHRYVGRFKQSVTINTNDPDRPQVVLSITGEYTEPLHTEPDEVNFNQIVGEKPTSREVRIYCKLTGDPLKIISHEFTDHDLAKFFEVNSRPLTAEQLAAHRGAASGLLVTVTAKPGLPPGPFRQTILMRTNLPSVKECELLLYGSMGKAVSVVGAGWDDDIGVLRIGPVKTKAAVERQLVLIARGLDAKEVRYNVVHVEPEFLKVKLGETAVSEEGRLSQTMLTIEVPERSTPASYMGDDRGKMGEIHIDTTSPLVHQLRILVRFAVEDAKPEHNN